MLARFLLGVGAMKDRRASIEQDTHTRSLRLADLGAQCNKK